MWVAEFDIRDFFGSIDHDRVVELVAARVSDRRVLKLIRLWLQAGVLDEGRHRQTVAGTPQGGVISPLLANIRVKALTGRNRCHVDIRKVVADLNPVLRGWGNYFRTGNAATKFNQLDWYVVGRLRRLLIKRYGRNLHAGRVEVWTREWFERHGLYRLRGTVRYPKAA